MKFNVNVMGCLLLNDFINYICLVKDNKIKRVCNCYKEF